MTFEKEGLPKGWSLLPFGNIKPSTERFDPTKEENRRYVGLEHIGKNTGKIIGSQESKMAVSSKTVFYRGDLLYGKLRPYLNKVAVADFDGVCSTDILVFQQNSFIVNTFLKLCLLKSDFVEFANSTVTGVQHPRTSHKKLSDYPIPLPPPSEQHRIVSKIESIFAQIDAIKKSLEKIKLLVKQQKQSILKDAFEGKLVLQNPNDQSIETVLQKTRKIFEREIDVGMAQSNWCVIQLEEYIKIAARIGWRGLKKSEYARKGALLLAVKDIGDDGQIHYDGVLDHLSDFRYEESPEIKIQKNDILITKDGTIGKIGFVHTIPTKTTVNSSILVVRPLKLIYPRYLFYYFKAPIFQKIVRDKIKGTAVPHLFQRDIKKFQINIAPLNEQKRIVSKIESIFGNIDSIEKQVNDAVRSLNTLKQSVLKLAFEGKLVPQDPNDEPASVLLEKIKLQKK